jgi:hypothetical protein
MLDFLPAYNLQPILLQLGNPSERSGRKSLTWSSDDDRQMVDQSLLQLGAVHEDLWLTREAWDHARFESIAL